MVKNYEKDMFSKENYLLNPHKINKQQYEDLKKKFAEINANIPVSFDDINIYPGSSKGPSPDDNPEHFQLWLKSELSRIESKAHPDYLQFQYSFEKKNYPKTIE